MKQLTNAVKLKTIVTFLMLLCFQTLIWAQDSTSSTTSSTTSTTDVNISETGDNWYASPWVWVIGGALFILLLVALTRGGGSSRRTTDAASSDRVTVTKTVQRDTDVDTDV